MTGRQALRTEAKMKQTAVVDLTNKGIIENGEFIGIRTGTGYYADGFEVVCGNVKSFKHLNAAKKYLTRLVPGWEKIA